MDDMTCIVNGHELQYKVTERTIPTAVAMNNLDKPPSYMYPEPTTAYPSYSILRTMTLRGVKKMK